VLRVKHVLRFGENAGISQPTHLPPARDFLGDELEKRGGRIPRTAAVMPVTVGKIGELARHFRGGGGVLLLGQRTNSYDPYTNAVIAAERVGRFLLGSLADIAQRPCDLRFAPESGHSWGISAYHRSQRPAGIFLTEPSSFSSSEARIIGSSHIRGMPMTRGPFTLGPVAPTGAFF
jgi:hypothetical protein